MSSVPPSDDGQSADMPRLRDYLSDAEMERFAAVMVRLVRSACEQRERRERRNVESEAES